MSPRESLVAPLRVHARHDRGLLLVPLLCHDVPERLLVADDVVAGLLEEAADGARRLRGRHHLELRCGPERLGRRLFGRGRRCGRVRRGRPALCVRDGRALSVCREAGPTRCRRRRRSGGSGRIAPGRRLGRLPRSRTSPTWCRGRSSRERARTGTRWPRSPAPRTPGPGWSSVSRGRTRSRCAGRCRGSRRPRSALSPERRCSIGRARASGSPSPRTTTSTVGKPAMVRVPFRRNASRALVLRYAGREGRGSAS